MLSTTSELNTTSRDEHVGDIERDICTVKERMRGISNTIPFKRLTRSMVMELAKAVVYWLNSVPSSTGVSPMMSPRTIITGQLLDYHKHCRYEFGEYVQTHEEHDNSLLSRTVGAIALRPTGNQQGGYFFMSLLTEFRQPLKVQSHLEMPRILVQLGHTQRTWKLAPQTDPKWSPTWSLTRFQPICPLRARDGRYACQASRAHRTHSRL